jgi:hypothetical protein
MTDPELYNLLTDLEQGRVSATHVYALLNEERERDSMKLNKFLIVLITLVIGSAALIYACLYFSPPPSL